MGPILVSWKTFIGTFHGTGIIALPRALVSSQSLLDSAVGGREPGCLNLPSLILERGWFYRCNDTTGSSSTNEFQEFEGEIGRVG